MHPRYPAPMASTAFNPQTQIDLWTDITQSFMVRRSESLNVYLEEGDRIDIDDMRRSFESVSITSQGLMDAERITGHEVVGFLSLFEREIPEHFRWLIHLGLTSSDLVENATLHTIVAHAAFMQGKVDVLMAQLKSYENQDTRRAGRTHGQLAAPTSWTHQFRVVYHSLSRINLDTQSWIKHIGMKSPGPTGMSTDASLNGEIASWVALDQGFDLVLPSTQVIQRDLHVSWASLYMRLAGVLENLALLIRLGARSEVAEVREGAQRVGSSAMPAKRNPIDCEKVCGMANLARSYTAAIASNSALWEDRDLSNSALERVAFQDLAGTVEHMGDTMIKVVASLQFDTYQMAVNLVKWQVWTHEMQLQLQLQLKMSPTNASKVIRDATSRLDGGVPTDDFNSVVGLVEARLIEEWDVPAHWVLKWANSMIENFDARVTEKLDQL